MSFEINPVLAGTFDTPAYGGGTVSNVAAAKTDVSVTASANAAAPAAVDKTDAASGPDPRRYTQFDRSITDFGTDTTFSFSDFLDTINPLEHVPILSSIYRAAVGEQINPVARVAGDILYGGIFGVASAALGGIGAIADAGLEQQTGKDSGGLVVAALFGPDDQPATTQLADSGKVAAPAIANAVAPAAPSTQTIELAESVTPAPALAALQVPDNQTPDVPLITTPPAPAVSAAVVAPDPAPASAPVVAPSPTLAANAQIASAAPNAILPPTQNPVTQAAASTAAVTANNGAGIPLPASGKAFALNPNNKQPYGGVMNTPKSQAEDMAIMLSAGAPGMRMGHMIYTNPLITGSHKMAPMLSSGAAAQIPATTPASVIAPPPTVAPAPSANPLVPVSSATPGPLSQVALPMAAGANPVLVNANTTPNQMLQSLMMQALSQYQSAASMAPNSMGRNVNLTN